MADETKFTDGPWFARPDRGEGGFYIGTARTGWNIADRAVAGDIVLEADAHLIAAAPDLYAAVKAQHEALDTLLATLIAHVPTFMPTKSPAWPAIEAGHAALAKARGEPTPPAGTP